MAVFDFCPSRNVPETLPRQTEGVSIITMGGWQFSSKPTTPYQKRFKVTLYGLRWYVNSTTGLFDNTTNPTFNAKRLEEFYEQHELWKAFDFPHQHLGTLSCRFAEPLIVPAGLQNSGGLIEKVEMNLIHHNPGYS